MEKGMAIIENTGAGTRSVFIDQEVLECARLNLRTKERIEKQKKERAAKARHKKCMERTENRILAEAAFAVAVTMAGTAGMIHPAIWIPAAIICLCGACVRLGMWFGRAVNANELFPKRRSER